MRTHTGVCPLLKMNSHSVNSTLTMIIMMLSFLDQTFEHTGYLLFVSLSVTELNQLNMLRRYENTYWGLYSSVYADVNSFDSTERSVIM